MKERLKQLLPDIIVVALFAAIAFFYFMPADIDGRILYQHDSQAGKGLGHELSEYYQKNTNEGSTLATESLRPRSALT